MRFHEFITEEDINGFKVQSLTSFVKNSDIEDNDEIVTEAELDAPYSDVSQQDIADYLGRVKNQTREKNDKFKFPYVHRSNIKVIDDENKELDIEALKREISVRPKALLKRNAKMQHSDGTADMFYNLGLPAIQGLIVDEDSDELKVVNTCPGAGICKTFCYAAKGGYVQFKNASMNQSRTLNFLINDPEGFRAALHNELAAAQKLNSKKGIGTVLRWHDAGDFFSPAYYDICKKICNDNPNVKVYCYTKMASVALDNTKPVNFIVNFSGGAKPSEQKQVDLVNIKHSEVVPRDVFSDLIKLDKDGNIDRTEAGSMQFTNIAELKQRVAKQYKLKLDTVKMYDEYIKMSPAQKGDIPKWNVIVQSGAGDDSAVDKSVLGTYLLLH